MVTIMIEKPFYIIFNIICLKSHYFEENIITIWHTLRILAHVIIDDTIIMLVGIRNPNNHSGKMYVIFMFSECQSGVHLQTISKLQV